MEFKPTRKKWSKEDAVFETISSMARRLGPEGQLPTVSQLCQTLSLSRSTLDRVLRKLEARQIIKRVHGSGIYVSPHVGRKTVGFVVGQLIFDRGHSPFWVQLLQSAQEAVRQKSDDIRFYFECPSIKDTAIREGSHLHEDLMARRLDGLLTVATAPQRTWLERWQIPVVGLGRQGKEHATVDTNSNKTYALGAECLLQAGCQSIGLLSVLPTFSGPSHQAMLSEALRVHGYTLDPGLVIDPSIVGRSGTHDHYGQIVARELFSDKGALQHVGKKLDGLFIVDDLLAYGFLHGLHRYGAHNRLKVATMCNEDSLLLQLYHQDIFRIARRPDIEVKAMYALLSDCMNGRQPKPADLVIDPILIPPAP